MMHRTFAHANTPPFECRPSVVVLPFGRESYLPAIVQAAGGAPVPMDETTDRIVFQLENAPAATTLVYCGMGGPAVANALEMVAANGSRRVVVFGACGGVDAAVGIGDLVVATGGVRNDGVSHYYAPPAFPAICEPDLTAALWRGAREAEVPAHRGVVHTTAASYRQGEAVYGEDAELVLAVECECAAAAVVGARLGLAVGCLLFCTDNVKLPESGDRHYRGLADSRVRRGFDQGLAVVLTALEACSTVGGGRSRKEHAS